MPAVVAIDYGYRYLLEYPAAAQRQDGGMFFVGDLLTGRGRPLPFPWTVELLGL